MKYWEELLVQWQDKGNTGLSIPFVVGSQQFIPRQYQTHDILNLLVDVASSSTIEVSLSYCMNIMDFILAVRDKSHSPGAGFYPSFKCAPQKSLFVSDFLKMGDNVETISASLAERLDYYILQGQYSINDGERGSFTGGEIQFILKCFSSLT